MDPMDATVNDRVVSIHRARSVRFAADATAIEGETVLMVRGELDLATQPRFMAALEGIDEGSSRIVLDMSELTFIDCANLRAIGRAQQLARSRGTEFVIRSAEPHIVRFMELTGLSTSAADDRARPNVPADGMDLSAMRLTGSTDTP